MLKDARHRVVNYLRVSVTDRCNLRCVYCMSRDVRFLSHEDILRYEEIAALIRAAVKLGVGKVRITGGEPFARKGLVPFLSDLKQEMPGLDLRLTTNATLIEPHLAALRAGGVDRLNISLDSLDAATFERVTRLNAFETVMSAIRRSLDMGFHVKINAVAMRGVNEADLPAFIEFARENPVDVRFIEFMPMGDSAWKPQSVWTADEILARARTMADLDPVPAGPDAGPARVFEIRGGIGRFGVISPLSNHFCGTCNRLRVTADGRLRTCLFSDQTYRIKGILRHPRLSQDALIRVLQLATRKKPIGVELLRKRQEAGRVCATRMSAIGG